MEDEFLAGFKPLSDANRPLCKVSNLNDKVRTLILFSNYLSFCREMAPRYKMLYVRHIGSLESCCWHLCVIVPRNPEVSLLTNGREAKRLNTREPLGAHVRSFERADSMRNHYWGFWVRNLKKGFSLDQHIQRTWCVHPEALTFHPFTRLLASH